MVGEATSASEGIVVYADFQDRPFSRVWEPVEVICGAVATQYSGEARPVSISCPILTSTTAPPFPPALTAYRSTQPHAFLKCLPQRLPNGSLVDHLPSNELSPKTAPSETLKGMFAESNRRIRLIYRASVWARTGDL